jgi:hypothetical protein
MYEDMIEDRDCKKTKWCKSTREFGEENFNLRYFLGRVIMQEKYRRLRENYILQSCE